MSGDLTGLCLYMKKTSVSQQVVRRPLGIPGDWDPWRRSLGSKIFLRMFLYLYLFLLVKTCEKIEQLTDFYVHQLRKFVVSILLCISNMTHLSPSLFYLNFNSYHNHLHKNVIPVNLVFIDENKRFISLSFKGILRAKKVGEKKCKQTMHRCANLKQWKSIKFIVSSINRVL